MEKSYKITKLVVCVALMCISLGVAIYFAIIPFVNINTSFNFKNPDYIEVHINTNYKKLIEKDDFEFNEILKLYSEAFSVNKSDLVFGNETIKDTSFVIANKTIDYKNGTYLVLGYNTNQSLTEGLTTVSYNKVVIGINDSETMTQTSAFVVDSDNAQKATFKYVSYSAGQELYKYLNNLA